MDTTPPPIPSTICLGLLALIFSLSFMYSSSFKKYILLKINSKIIFFFTIVNAAIPEDTDPVILDTELKAPEIVLVNKEADPLAIPSPVSKGPCTSPSIGLETKSSTPEEILEKSPTGLPITLREPKTFSPSVIA